MERNDLDCHLLGPPIFNSAELALYLTLNTLSSITAIIGNGIVMGTIASYRHLRNKSTYLLLCLSITDMTVGLLVQPMSSTLAVINVTKNYTCMLTTVTQFLSTSMCGISAALVALISYDRYVHLTKLKNYNLHMTRKKVMIWLTYCWLFTPVITCFLLSKSTVALFDVVYVINSIMIIVVICVSYYKSWRSVKRNFGKIQSTSVSLQESRRINKQWSVAKSMSIVVFCCLMAWTPVTVILVILETRRYLGYSLLSFRGVYKVFFWCLLCGYINSCVNPILYFWKNHKLREAMKQFIFEKIFRKSIRTETIESANSKPQTLATECKPELRRCKDETNVFPMKEIERPHSSTLPEIVVLHGKVC